MRARSTLAAPSLPTGDFVSGRREVGGFLYCIPVVGPTGGPSASIEAIAEAVARCRNVSPLPVMVGFGVKTPAMDAAVADVADGVIVATALMLAFSYSFSWIQAWIGLSVSSVEAANSAGFIWMFPLTFVSSAFVPTDTMPAAMRWFAERNPFTIVTNAARALYSGNPVGSDAWVSFAWAAGITVVFATISIRAFTRSAAR